jgi:DNA-binding GntR family transcriptional regulator
MRVSVTDRLRSLILENHLPSGARLVQSEIADKLGVSRTPVREALQELASEGLVRLLPYRGAVVSEVSLADLEELYAVRIALEGYSVNLAAQLITDEQLEELETYLHRMHTALEQGEISTLMELNFQFNSALFAASKQSLLCEAAIKAMRAANRYRRFHFSVERLAAAAIAEHWELLAVLRKRDSEAAERLDRHQAARSIAALRELFQTEAVEGDHEMQQPGVVPSEPIDATTGSGPNAPGL